MIENQGFFGDFGSFTVKILNNLKLHCPLRLKLEIIKVRKPNF